MPTVFGRFRLCKTGIGELCPASFTLTNFYCGICEHVESNRVGHGVLKPQRSRAWVSKVFSDRSSSFVDTSTTSYDGLSRLCSYGATKTQIALAIAACPRLKKLGTQSPRVRLGDRRLEARIVYLTLCRSPSADQSPWPSWLLDSRYGSPAGQCCRPAVLCHPQSFPLPTRLT